MAYQVPSPLCLLRRILTRRDLCPNLPADVLAVESRKGLAEHLESQQLGQNLTLGVAVRVCYPASFPKQTKNILSSFTSSISNFGQNWSSSSSLISSFALLNLSSSNSCPMLRVTDSVRSQRACAIHDFVARRKRGKNTDSYRRVE